MVFVTTMYRYGNRELHSYVLGVWSTREIAMQAGETEALWRGGKYEPEVTEWKVDANEFDDMPEERPTQRALDAACTSCKLELTPQCPIRTGNGCDLYQPRQ